MLRQGEGLRETVEASIGQPLPDVAQFIGKLDEAGEVISVAAFAEWRGFDVELHLCSAGTMHRDFLRRLSLYAFDELGVTYVRCGVAANRPEWLAQVKRLGFQEEGRLRGGVDGHVDQIRLSITREEFIL